MDYAVTAHGIATTKKRLVGASVFGLVLGGYLLNALQYTVPVIFSIVQKVDLATAQSNHESSVWPRLLIFLIASTVAAGTAAFIARKRGILVGLFANSLGIIALGLILYYYIISGVDILIGNISLQLYVTLQLLVLIIGSVLGGYLGEIYYSPLRDPDLGNDKLTVFGIRWGHYFWILPFILFPFLASVIMLTYFAVLTFIVEFYFLFHPSIWLKPIWWIYAVFSPIFAGIAGVLCFGGFGKFYETMEYGERDDIKTLKKVGSVILYGFGGPALSFPIAAYGAELFHNLPRPASGDWKIVVIIFLIGLFLAVIIVGFGWLKEKLYGG